MVTDIENKTPDNTNLATKAGLNTKVMDIENEISDTSRLVKKTGCNTKTTETVNKVPGVIRIRSINSKVTSNKTRQVHFKKRQEKSQLLTKN